jgi:predicted RNA-binding protein with PUA-like domain
LSITQRSGKKTVSGWALVKTGYPDDTAWDPESNHFDPKSTPQNPVWYMVDIQLEMKFQNPIHLAELRQVPELKDMMLLKKGMRLSIQPVTPEAFRIILYLRKRKSKKAR